MADHSELVAEITMVEKMSTQERLKHAKKRRNQQIKKFSQYERQLDKDHNKKNKKNQGNKKPPPKKQRTIRITFDSNVMLLEAAARNDIDEVRGLLAKGVSPDVTNEDGLTALHQCCIDDSEAMMKLLIEFGANVNARDSELWSPLHAAATCGHIHLCKYLIDKGAELLAVNADGNMPYDICEDETTLDFIESEMAKRGVTQELIDEMRLSREKNMLADLKMLFEKNGDLEFRDRNGATPLHIASANGYIQVVEFLLDQHVNLDLRDDDSWQPIHAAACWGQLAILELLVHNGADLDAKTKNGESPHDICEEPEMKQRIIELKDEIEHNRASKSSELKHRRSQNTRSSMMSNSTSSLYNSNTSLAGDKNPFSASVRRTSMRDKSAISWKEAREEAKMMRSSAASDEEEEDNNNAQNRAKKGPGGEGTPNALSPAMAGEMPSPAGNSAPTTNVNKPAAKPKTPPNLPANKTVIIEEMKDRPVPATNLDDVKVHVPTTTPRDAPTGSNQKGSEPAALPLTRDSIQMTLEEKERERLKNEANCNSSDLSSSRDSAIAPPNSNYPSTIPPSGGGGAPRGAFIGSPPHIGTLADLKKARQQQLQNHMQKQKGGLAVNDVAASTNGNGSLPQNGHSPSLSADRSSPTPNSNDSTPTGNNMFFPPPPRGEPPKHRFTATQPSEIVGDNGKQACCVIL